MALCLKRAYLLQHMVLRSPGMETAGECGAGDIATSPTGPRLPLGASRKPSHCAESSVCQYPLVAVRS